MIFLTLREQFVTLQSIANAADDNCSLGMVGFAAMLSKESIVDVTGVLVKPQDEIQACSIKLELQIHKIFCVNRSNPKLAFQLKDASRRLEKGETEGLGDSEQGQ